MREVALYSGGQRPLAILDSAAKQFVNSAGNLVFPCRQTSPESELAVVSAADRHQQPFEQLRRAAYPTCAHTTRRYPMWTSFQHLPEAEYAQRHEIKRCQKDLKRVACDQQLVDKEGHTS